MAARDTKALIVKVSHGNEIRRFSANADALTWSSLAKNTASLFGLSACASASLKLTYLDDENDRVTISSDAELAEAVELALAAAPPVLRLALLAKPATNDSTSQAHVPTADASTAADKPPTAEAGNMTKPRTAEAASHATRPPTAEAGNMTNKQADTHGSAPPPYTPHAAGGAPPMAAYPNEEMAAFFSTLARQLPTLVAQLPPGVRSLLPHAELDVAATLAANAAANASCAAAAAANDVAAAAAAAAAAPPPANGAPEDKEPAGVHVGVTCDRSGVCPIVGWRYHLVGHNYDLCQNEYDKLDDKEKALYQRLPPPPTPYTHTIGAEANNNNASQGVHPGVECDRSGLCPIVGMRYNLRGHNYDLCQNEYDKLPANEKLLYTPIPPPDGNGSNNNNAQAPPWRGSAGQWGGGRGWGGGGRWGGGGGGGCGFAGGNGGTGGGGGWGGAAKLAARFVRDVTVFDGTQMNPDTPFTKIWRLKNTGEVAWPPGTRMLFVGGDQMSTEMSVPLSRASAVLPGEEVDVAVEMVAPQALGRYLGYWRLVGPHGRRKFGQRVWCHVQVVDPSEGAPPLMTEADLDRTRREIESKKSALAADETDADPADDPPPTPTRPVTDVTAGVVTAEDPMDLVATAAPPTVTDVTDEAAERGSSDDEAIVVTEAMALEAKGAVTVEGVTADGVTADGVTVDGVTADGPQTVGGVAEALGQMGFTDTALVQVALEKHGADLSACARDLAQSSEWESLLSDLEEMGFQNRQLNKSLLLKHSGNVKQTVRALVEDA